MVDFFSLGSHKIFGYSLTEDAVIRISTLIGFLKRRKSIEFHVIIYFLMFVISLFCRILVIGPSRGLQCTQGVMHKLF